MLTFYCKINYKRTNVQLGVNLHEEMEHACECILSILAPPIYIYSSYENMCKLYVVHILFGKKIYPICVLRIVFYIVKFEVYS